VQVYEALKQKHKNKSYPIAEPKIGLLKNIHQIDSAKDTWTHYCAAPLTRFISGIADMIQNGSVYRFFTQGEYRVHVPFLINVTHKNEKAVNSLDFIGLNYYSNRHLFITKTVEPTDPQLRSDNNVYYHYPQGMFRAICELDTKLVQPYKTRSKELPIIVAENGIATKDENKRKQFYHEYLYAIHRAIKAGKVVQGYLPWTLATNYEWPTLVNNTERDYGLCSVDEQDPSKLQVKQGAASYMEFVAQMKKHEETEQQVA
jgi:beta-glucosidase